ncbi:MAG: tRNA (guanosine(37)-N1)-methyltransferase TrmD [Candidatus Gastranaerophilales bacterium]|nr:tRNA (guanosine(37)-N1)-methyltransferase TrmD [Candidatus Gastranaerophilales bacterium]
MRFDVVTLFPDIIKGACSESMPQRAGDKGLISINTVNPRDYTHDKHRKTDDTPYGGGAGMVLSCQPFMDALNSIEKEENSGTIIMTPQGEIFNQKMAKEFASKSQIRIICGHYEGFDERIRILSKAREVSLGDFVLSGGEYSAICIIDAVSRLLEGTLGNSDSKEYDSHSEYLLEYPQYTKPREYEGLEVPEVLLSGNHEKIAEWRRRKQFERTKQKRPDLFSKFIKTNLSDYDKKILKEFE